MCWAENSTIIAVYGDVGILIENVIWYELSSSSDSQHFTLGSFYFIFYILTYLWEQIADHLRLLIVQLDCPNSALLYDLNLKYVSFDKFESESEFYYTHFFLIL